MAFLPAVIIGIFAVDFIKHVVFSPVVVACALIIGGLIIFAVEASKFEPKTIEATDISLKQAILVGLAQCVAMIPVHLDRAQPLLAECSLAYPVKQQQNFLFPCHANHVGSGNLRFNP